MYHRNLGRRMKMSKRPPSQKKKPCVFFERLEVRLDWLEAYVTAGAHFRVGGRTGVIQNLP